MDKFSVKKLALLAGVSVRTLHHYDKIGLLKPLSRSNTNYRYYGREELLRLQQILLYKEMDLPLSGITKILNDPDFDIINALEGHKSELKRRRTRMSQLLLTVDNTISQLKSKKMDYNEMYKGFAKEQAEAYRKEAAERWGEDTIASSEKKILAMSKDEWNAVLQKGEELNKSLVDHMQLSPGDERVQDLIKEHYKLMGMHFDVTLEIYANLASMYVDDERFKSYYDKYHDGLAVFLRDAIHVFCKRNAS